ncbi:hypothetical protein [Herbiconiux daphne]|uniref:Uncharacterized protein n=1 Tax=Herbiconiux daphne TaxID=2970914 RepID=A0ABT2H573_9MICO|nr:hypothetical protein [Herbiconiux daphne]MCS5735064.1 hypothetical protein [Herbiconiux daphne]
MLYIARGIEDDHYWVVQNIDSALTGTPWRIEREWDGYRVSHADDRALSALAFELGAIATPEDAVDAIRGDLL